MILFDVEDAVGVARLNKEIMDFLAIAEPAVTMEIKEAANRGEFSFWWSSEKNKKVAEILFPNSEEKCCVDPNKFTDALIHSLKDAGYKVRFGSKGWYIEW
jgi:hypothetical protein